MDWQAAALASEFLSCPEPGTSLDHQAVPGASSACQAVLPAGLSISLALPLAWQAVLPNCPATLSVYRAVPTAALSACRAVSPTWRAGPWDCPGMLLVCRTLQSAELLACQAVSFAWRAAVPSDCPATVAAGRAVRLECQVVC